jgi:hypothetical protein
MPPSLNKHVMSKISSLLGRVSKTTRSYYSSISILLMKASCLFSLPSLISMVEVMGRFREEVDRWRQSSTGCYWFSSIDNRWLRIMLLLVENDWLHKEDSSYKLISFDNYLYIVFWFKIYFFFCWRYITDMCMWLVG